MLERMRASAICHIEMAGELATLRMAVFSVTESVLGRSPSDTFRVEVVGELVIKFKKMKVRRSRLERPTTRVCDLLLGSPPSRA
jgi:putative ubiquitin-RnfH superfamily antitoxin RatB of RatAB toxin-antitoxin module